MDRVRHEGGKAIVVNEQVLAAISPVRQPSGVVALAPRRSGTIDDVLERRPPLVLMLCDVQDPGNVGAIVRAAEACGATGLVTGEGTADPFGWKALRGGMGSTFRLPIAAKTSLPDVVRRSRDEGLRVFATMARDGTPLPECDLRGGVAILLGGEGAGLPEDLARAADERITIPMHRPVESLNVAIAAALIVYEADRQRHAAGVHAGVHDLRS
jgi:TrmH family RNA methyltransferase